MINLLIASAIVSLGLVLLVCLLIRVLDLLEFIFGKFIKNEFFSFLTSMFVILTIGIFTLMYFRENGGINGL